MRAHKTKLLQVSCSQKADSLHAQGNTRRKPRGKLAKGENDVMEMLKNISSCLASLPPRFESYVGCTPPSKDLTQSTSAAWVKKGTHG